MGTIQRVFRDIGMKLFEKAGPGESVQVDVKYVRIADRWAFQYTADCTRFRVLRLYRRLHHGSSLAFLTELQRALPFPIKRLQCDHGHEFSFAFVLGVEAAGIRHHYIRPRRPQQNGKVETPRKSAASLARYHRLAGGSGVGSPSRRRIRTIRLRNWCS
jgi:transposase InsO family protein